ncbi:MAG: membrane protein insertase YidC [Ignavibacteriales bacterium]|nr:membrane protein insertase YidC [Ignavibacteriales bacterium]
MDRQATLGYILIFVLLVVWMWMSTPPPAKQAAQKAAPAHVQDSVKIVQPKQAPTEEKQPKPSDPYGKFFSSRAQGQEKILTIETDLFKAEISTKGGLIKTWELKKYTTWDNHPVQLVDYQKMGDFSLLFTTSDGRLVNTRDLYFDFPANVFGEKKLTDGEEFSLDLTLPAANGGRIVKRLHFKNGEYGFDTDMQFVNVADVIANFEYQVVWESGLRYAEHNSADESGFAYAHAYAGKELTEIDATDFDTPHKKELSGAVDWVSTRTKYFALAIIPKAGTSDGAYLEGNKHHMPDKGMVETYSIAVRMPFKGGADETGSFKIFLGPVDIHLLKTYNVGLENIISLGWTWLIRPISEYVMLPLLSFIHYIVPNWGIAIIIFSIIIKIALHPLTKSSMASMKKMQALQPMMDEIREKYKDDPQKMNTQVMNLYKEYGVNPAGGCLPLLLQFPILIALFNIFRATIELRHANFFWWITDLSIPDKIFSLPFEIPFFGVRDVSGLSLAMGITIFVQQKMSVKDPRQKAMIWMMPIMMTLMFNSFPSGLNLYYFVFNILSIGQQMIINRQADKEPLRKVEPKKKGQGGIFSKMPKELTKFGKKQ